jgi:hypothetical protein
MRPPEMRMNDAVKSMTLVVTISQSPQFRIRLAVGLLIVRLGAFVIGIGRFRVEET